jgi:hypothetical protein
VLNAVLNRALDAWEWRNELAGLWAAGAAAALGLLLVNGLWPGGTDTAWRLMMGTQRPPQVESHLTVLRQLHRLQKVVRPGATIATAWAGIPAYFSDYKLVDVLGFNDRHVARAPSRLPGDEDHPRLYRPGHDRWDFDYLLVSVRPDAFFQVWGPRLEGLKVGELMTSAGYRRRNGIWYKRDSPYVGELPAEEAPLRAARQRRNRQPAALGPPEPPSPSP